MRLIAKTTTYGLMHVAIAFFVALAVSRDLHIALAISLLEPCVQIIFFGVHEYLWERRHPGQKLPHHDCCGTAAPAHKLASLLRRIFGRS